MENVLYVQGIAIGVTPQNLEDEFAKFGTVTNIKLLLDPYTKENRGFGFVTMDSSASAEAATQGLHGIDFFGRSLIVAKSKRARARSPTPGNYLGQNPPRSGRYNDGYRRERRYRSRSRSRDRDRYSSRRESYRDEPRSYRDEPRRDDSRREDYPRERRRYEDEYYSRDERPRREEYRESRRSRDDFRERDYKEVDRHERGDRYERSDRSDRRDYKEYRR